MAEGVEHFLKMFIIICISSLENSLFSSLAIFFSIGLFAFFFFLIIFETSPTIFSDLFLALLTYFFSGPRNTEAILLVFLAHRAHLFS